MTIRRLLVANRGEIAIRILRAARELSIETVAVYSDADRSARHLTESDRAERIGPAPAIESYLSIPALIEAARRAQADAIHPGYGFLAESPAFAEACEEAGIRFVGPPPEAMRALGDKRRARALAQRAGVPVVPGYEGDTDDPDRMLEEARRIGLPLLVKASAGGGGKGMRRVDRFEDLPGALAAARREAEAAFGDGRLLLERLLESVRHVEIQVLCDVGGRAIHLGERDCSVQRRHQKIVEQSPSPAVDARLRARMGEAAIALARESGYENAGTVEFLLAPDGNFYFLEVNTRLQVEHPVTEAVTGIDLVHAMLRIATGEPLPLEQRDVALRGSAIEARVYAEDPQNGFLPAAGTVLLYREPSGPGIRVDSGILGGSEVSVHYDPILAKVIAHHADRDLARARLRGALAQMVVLGVATNVPFLQDVLAHPRFVAGEETTAFVEEAFDGWTGCSAEVPDERLAAAAMAELLEPGGGAGGRGTPGAPAGGDPYSPWKGGI